MFEICWQIAQFCPWFCLCFYFQLSLSLDRWEPKPKYSCEKTTFLSEPNQSVESASDYMTKPFTNSSHCVKCFDLKMWQTPLVLISDVTNSLIQIFVDLLMWQIPLVQIFVCDKFLRFSPLCLSVCDRQHRPAVSGRGKADLGFIDTDLRFGPNFTLLGPNFALLGPNFWRSLLWSRPPDSHIIQLILAPPGILFDGLSFFQDSLSRISFSLASPSLWHII